MTTIKKLISPALMIALAIMISTAYLAGTPQQAAGHGGNNYDDTEHDRGKHHSHQNDHAWWAAGSRCVGQTHIDRKHSTVIGHHGGFSSSEYTAGPAQGTLPAKSLSFTKQHISDQWEVRLSWKASGYQASNNTWACQPKWYQAQRKIGNGTWERWEHQPPQFKPLLRNPQPTKARQLPQLRPLPLQASHHRHTRNCLVPRLQQG